MRIAANLDANDRQPEPGELFVCDHTDSRNRLCYLRPLDKRVAGYHVVDSSHGFGFVADADVAAVHPGGESVLVGGKVHQVLGRFGKTLKSPQPRVSVAMRGWLAEALKRYPCARAHPEYVTGHDEATIMRSAELVHRQGDPSWVTPSEDTIPALVEAWRPPEKPDPRFDSSGRTGLYP